MKVFYLFLLLGILPLRAGDEDVVSHILFASCAHEYEDQPMWKAILEDRPQVFIFEGDTIYGDSHKLSVLRKKYAQLSAKPYFEELRESTRFLAIWDDHDFGVNDGGADFKHKDVARQAFMEFFHHQYPADSPVRERKGGLYDAFLFGPEARRIQIILLDTRYYRGPLKRNPLPKKKRPENTGPYLPSEDTASSMLGETQWKWLEQQLKKPARLRIIASTNQVLSWRHGWESWGTLPHERTRLLDLARKTGAEGMLFISGDVHKGELCRWDDAPYPLYDFTSSGITHAWSGTDDLAHPHRVEGMTYGEPNYGVIDIDWDQPDPLITLSLRTVTGTAAKNKHGAPFQHKISLSELSFKK